MGKRLSKAAAESNELFRTVVTYPWGEDVFGPFATLGAAKAARTREAEGTYYQPDRHYPTKVQRSVQNWEDVE